MSFRNEIEYHTFWFLLEIGEKTKHLEFPACDSESAKADIYDAYGEDVTILTWGMH